MYRLVETDDLGREFSVALPAEREEILIGRTEENDVIIPGNTVSRRHARIQVHGDGIAIEDLASANGVIVNNMRIQGLTPIKAGDEIIIGEHRFFLRAMKTKFQMDATLDLSEMGKGNLVVAKFLDGQMVRGQTLDVGGKPTFHLQSAGGEVKQISIDELKALFFVKTSPLAKDQAMPRYGKKILLRFNDGEVMVGSSIDYREDKEHFIVFPMGEHESNERILVNRKAVQYIRVLGVTYGLEKDPEPIVPDQKQMAQVGMEAVVRDVVYSLALDVMSQQALLDDGFFRKMGKILGSKLDLIRREYEKRFGAKAWSLNLTTLVIDVNTILGKDVADTVQKIIARMGASS